MRVPTIEVRLHIPTPPGDLRTAHFLDLMEVLVKANAEWVYNELMEGRHVACCLGCIEPKIVYIPPPDGTKQMCQNWWSLPDIMARGRANCLDAACADAGIQRGHAFYEAARGLPPEHDPEAQGWLEVTSPIDYHAVAIIQGKRVDSSKKLVQGSCGCVAS